MLETFLADVVYEHLCINRSQVSCYDNILKYTNTYTVPEKFDFSRESILRFLLPTTREQVHRVYKTRIFLADNVSTEAINAISALQNPGIIIGGDVVYVDPTRFDRTRGIDVILTTLGVTPQDLDDALQLRPNRNVDIIEKLDPELSLKIDEKISAQNALVKQQPLKAQEEFIRQNTFYKCVKLIDHSVREYPVGPVAAQVT